MNVLVDADACPAKDEILEICKRHQIVPVYVANAPINSLKNRRDARMQVVEGNFDAADDWIVETATAGDLVMTADLLLAQRAARKHVDAMNFSGTSLTDEVIHDMVAQREIHQHLREMNLPSHQPAAYGKKNRSRLKSSLHEWIERRKRAADANRPAASA